MIRWLLLAGLLLAPAAVHAQTGYQIVPACVVGQQAAGNSAGYMDINGNICVSGQSSVRTLVPLDVATVTTASTAVTALKAGNATAGGILVTANAAGMCVNQIGTAGTVTSGNTICVAANQTYTVIPSRNAVSVNSTGAGALIAGYGEK